jgi:hypothetical protein
LKNSVVSVAIVTVSVLVNRFSDGCKKRWRIIFQALEAPDFWKAEISRKNYNYKSFAI